MNHQLSTLTNTEQQRVATLPNAGLATELRSQAYATQDPTLNALLTEAADRLWPASVSSVTPTTKWEPWAEVKPTQVKLVELPRSGDLDYHHEELDGWMKPL
jgi:hypothetical protein